MTGQEAIRNILDYFNSQDINFMCNETNVLIDELDEKELLDNILNKYNIKDIHILERTCKKAKCYDKAINDTGSYKDVIVNRKYLKHLQEDELKYRKKAEKYKNIKNKLQRWLELLETDGIDSKSIVANDIQYMLNEVLK